MAQGTTPRKNYTADDHKQAYDTYFLSRNLSDVQRTHGLAYETVLRWSKDNFNCPHSCVYHGWNKRIQEQLQALASNQKMDQQGVSDPVARATAMDLAVGGDQYMPPTKAEVNRAIKAVTTDEERLHQWRLLWAKVYFELTGVPLDYATLLEAKTATEQLFQSELMKRGLKVTSAPEAIRALVSIQEQIVVLERRMQGPDAGLIVESKPIVRDPIPEQEIDAAELRKIINLAD